MSGGIGDGLYIELGTIGNTKDLEKFCKMCRNTADAIEKAHKKQDKLDKGTKSLAQGMVALAGAIIGAGMALNRLTNDLVKSNQTFINLTRQSDIALSTFQKWDGIGKLFGIENASQQLESLNQKLFELRLTGQGARGFQLAGINPIGQDAQGVLEQLRGRIRGMNNTTATYLLQQMGLDPRMITLLRMSRDEFEELGQTIKKYQLTDKQREDIEKMNIQLQLAGMKLQFLKQRALLAIMPYLTQFMASLSKIAVMFGKVVNWFTKGSIASRGLLVAITALLIKFRPLTKLFTDTNGVIGKLLTKLPILGQVFKGLGAIFWRALLPLTALFLLLDDLATYFEGGDSLIGRVMNWANERGGELGDAFKKMFGGDFFGGLGDLGSVSFDALFDILQSIADTITIIANFLTFGLWNKFKEWDENNVQNITSGFATGGASGIPNDAELASILADDPDMVQSIDNSNTISNASKNVVMDIDITTNQPAQDINRELRYSIATT